MSWQGSDNLDPSLVPFLEAPDGNDAERQLDQLIADSTPTIKGIVRGKLRASLDPKDGSVENQDALDVLGDVQTQLFAELRRLKNGSARTPIADFHGYLAVVTYHACYQHLRRKYPERWRLKNKLRYLLTHRPELTLWKNDEGQMLCDLASKDQSGMPGPSAASHELLKAVPEPLRLKLSRGDPQPGPLTELLIRILERSDGPIVLDDLVNTVAGLCDIERHAIRAEQIEDSAQPADPPIDFARTLERRIHLEQLWREICQLPLRHRAAILLNLRDEQGRGVITLLPVTRVATIRQIAEALEFSLEDFASVWGQLPWDDRAIAQHLGLTRQQVINLRHSARTRLARRLKGY
jgi:DNA-directed RNA polymerase specialized sigma24 family protein